ncbi:MAG: quinolinate synthase [Desulfobulbus propionicus]|nr:MAG: quinolinate synthase [Desulfobulbus propionicus]
MSTELIKQEADVCIPVIKAPPYPEQERLDRKEKEALKEDIRQKLKELNGVLVAHYYTDGELQDLAEETGGCVADSLEMARFGTTHRASTLVVAGVRFMGETSKILNVEKRVLMPDLTATCSLDECCPIELFNAYCDQYPEHTVIVYANTSAEVKARSDWVVTSGIALPIIRHLAEKGEKILWAPDKHLGQYVQQMTGVEMIFWPGSCLVHEEFKANAIKQMQRKHPQAAVLVHPESPQSVVALADVVGSTTAMIDAVVHMDNPEYIVATEAGILHKMQQLAPDKKLLPAPTLGLAEGAEGVGRALCPWMGMNTLRKLVRVLDTGDNEVHVAPELAEQAKIPIQRMLDFAARMKQS